MSLILYAAHESSATPVIQAVLELQVPHELVLLELPSSATTTPAFLAINPNGKVPVLVVDGTPLFEASAILQWLGDTHGVARGMWPARSDPARLEALSWTTWCYVELRCAIHRMLVSQGAWMPEALRSEAHAAHARDELRALLEILEGRLTPRPYLLGDTFTLADLVVANMIAYGAVFDAPLDGLPHVGAWLARFRARPSSEALWGPPGAHTAQG